MPTEAQIIAAMDEWLATDGLAEPEIALIRELKQAASRGEPAFRDLARLFAEHAAAVVIGAVTKARQQEKCQCWPD